MGDMRIIVCLIGLAFMLASCGTGGGSVSSAPATGYKVGSPYKINGKRYQPKHDPQYNKVGTASWYGRKFHGKKTANGEIFNMHAMTAAHPTLTLPAEVRVTNLSNNRSVVLRVNDRGPFKRDRIIDVSRAAAEKLGFLNQGTAKVRVEYLGLAALNPNDRWASASESDLQVTSASTGSTRQPATFDEIVQSELRNITPIRPKPEHLTTSEISNENGLRSSLAHEGDIKSSEITTSAIPPQQQHRASLLPGFIPIKKPISKDLSDEDLEGTLLPTGSVPPKAAPTGLDLGKNADQNSVRYSGLVDRPTLQHNDAELFISDVYLSAVEAELARQEFSSHGKVQVSSVHNVQLGEYYVVKLGPFPSQHHASAALVKLRETGHKGAILTAN